MIDFAKLSSGKLNAYPFQTAAFENLVPIEKIECMRTEYPKDNFIMYERKMGHDKTYKQCGRHFIVPGDNKIYKGEELSDIWHELFEDLHSVEYREAMESLIGVSLKNAYLGADFWRFDPGSGCYIAPHADVPWKIVTHLFYYVKTWDKDWGGMLRYHDCDKMDDVAIEVVPSMKISPVLVRSDRSFHSIETVNKKAPESRTVLDIVFYNQIPPEPKPGRLCSDVLPVENLAD